MNKNKKEIVIPENIKYEISEKGFYLYRWITNDEIKMSIERDFLKILKYAGPSLAVISILSYFITSSFYFFIGVILFGIILIVSYLLGISIYRSFLLIKNSFVVVSDTSLYVGGKSLDLDDLDKISKETQYISKVFEEALFGTSWLELSKKTFYSDVSNSLLSGFGKILNKSTGRNKNVAIITLLLYLVYTILLSVSYFIGVFILWAFTLLLTIVNKTLLKIVGNKAIIINDLFNEINRSSENISDTKNGIFELLEEAVNNEWKDGLLLKINSFLDFINSEAENSIENSLKLKKEVENSDYSEIINFSVYNSWLKKQIKEPLIEIKELLLINLESLTKSKKDISLKIKNLKRQSLISALELQKERLSIQDENIQKNILQLDLYIKKL